MYIGIKQKAIKLRKLGYTYSDINARLKLKISKATFGNWFSEIHLTEQELQKLQKNINKKLVKARNVSKKVRASKRKVFFKSLQTKNKLIVGNLDINTQKIILSILYLGEGSKSKSSQNFSLGSSNPEIIRLYLALLNKCFVIDKSKFRTRIQCRADQDVQKIENYWLKVTKLPKSQFYSTYIDKRTAGSTTRHINYKGVCVITYFNRYYQYEVETLADSVIKYMVKGR